MELQLNRKITAKDYTNSNKEWCIREHKYGFYKFTEGYVEWLEYNYVKNKQNEQTKHNSSRTIIAK